MAKLQKSGIYVSLLAFVAVAVYLFSRGCFHHLLLGVGATFILYATTDGDLVGSIMAGAVIAFAMTFFMKKTEGFETSEPVRSGPGQRKGSGTTGIDALGESGKACR